MPTSPALRLVAALLASVAFASASHPFLCTDYNGNKVAAVSAEGVITWEFPAKNPQDCWRLPNGNYLFTELNGAKEVTPEKIVAWSYQSPPHTEVHGCQPLPNGSVLIVECGPSRLVEVDRSGKVTKEIKLSTDPAIALHNQFRGARKTPAGHYFICFKGEGKIVELDSSGSLLRSIKVPGDPHEVVPRPNGNLLITCGDGHQVIELDPTEKIVWQLHENDLPGNPLRLIAGCQRLPNGNTVFCNYLGHGHVGKQPQFFEITPDKKVVWQFEDHAHFKTINQIFLLDLPENSPLLR